MLSHLPNSYQVLTGDLLSEHWLVPINGRNANLKGIPDCNHLKLTEDIVYTASR